jgi:hypothetical protein
MGTAALIESLLATDLVVGLNSNTLTFTSGDSQCIIDLLPGSGPAKKITGANTCASHPGIQIKNGRIYNILLAQTITLGLNLRLDSDLGNLPILSDTLVTAESSGCDVEGDTATSGYTKYAIPQSVYNVLLLNGTLTVYDLYNLANTGLGGGAIGATTLAAISDAVDVINRGFDECRIGGFQEALKSGAANSPAISNGKDNTDLDAVSLNSYPNPFKSSTNISFSIPTSGHVKVDIYSLTGVKVATIYDNYADADQVYKIEFNGQSQINQATYICVISTEAGTKYQRIMMVR